MRYQNTGSVLFRFVNNHACNGQTDGQTDRITTPKTALTLLRRAVKSQRHEIATVLRLASQSWRLAKRIIFILVSISVFISLCFCVDCSLSACLFVETVAQSVISV